MHVTELSAEQREELKQSYLCEMYDEQGLTPSWGELADAGTTISDEEISRKYDGIDFVNDDFFCTCGE